ncbi:MAG: hypothetical protein IK132_09055 [Clostridia bacterium]|nr:hypothetical protein [Clostridia bacterium]
MEFHVYTPTEIIADPQMVDSFLDIMAQNLSWLFGPDMDSEENRNEWKRNNLLCVNPILHAVVGYRDSKMVGFIHYSIQNHKLIFHEFEITLDNRFAPSLIRGLLKTLFSAESCHFDTMHFYINRKNERSLDNFARYASRYEELPRGYSFIVDEEKTAGIVSRFS